MKTERLRRPFRHARLVAAVVAPLLSLGVTAPALEMTRRALDAARGRTFEDALARVEDLYLNELMKTEDADEGIRAFIEKRKPVWRNR